MVPKFFLNTIAKPHAKRLSIDCQEYLCNLKANEFNVIDQEIINITRSSQEREV